MIQNLELFMNKMNNKVIDLFDSIKCVSNSLHLNKIFNMLYKFVLNPVYIIFIKPIAKMFVFMFIIIIKFTIFVFKLIIKILISIPLFLSLLLICSLSAKSAKGVMVVIFGIFSW